jgi:AcrR family transcriptional regulator
MASEAARLAAAEGLATTTVDQIAEAAEVGRATFFRYFDAKELAVAEGFAGEWLARLTDVLAAQPARLSPMAAVGAAFAELASWFEAHQDAVCEQATLARSSPVLRAWTLEVHRRAEEAIAELVAPRFRHLEHGDPRPRLVGAAAMAAVRIVVDGWLEDGGKADLPAAIARSLAAVSIR